MKTVKEFKEYLPANFLSEDYPVSASNYGGFNVDTLSPISGNNIPWTRPDPTKTVDGKRELFPGDPVKIVNPKEFNFGTIGRVQRTEKDHSIVVVRFKNDKIYSYSWKDVEYYDFGKKDNTKNDKDKELYNLKVMSGIINPNNTETPNKDDD